MHRSSTVTVSFKYQVTIPAEVRKICGIKPGEKYAVFGDTNTVTFVRLRPIEEYQGFLKGIDSNVERDEEDRV